jgi:hypothetical protein
MIMLRCRPLHLLGALAVTVALAAPASATASGTSPVVAAIGSEVAITAATPSVMTLSHAGAGASSSIVTVTATLPSWTLSIADQNTGANAGHLLKTVGGTPLANPLQWSADNVTFNALSGAPATVGTGSLVGVKTVYFNQSLGSLEDVAAGDSYTLTIVYTVS